MKRFFILISLFATALFAQPPALTIDTIMRGPNLAGYEPRDLRWSRDGQRLYFGWKQYADPLEKDYDTSVVGRDGKGLRKLSEEEAKDAPPVRAEWTRDKKRAVYTDMDDVFLYDSATGKRRNLTNTIEAESNPRFTREERHVSFVRGNNLFVISLDDGSIAQVTNIIGADEKQPLWDEKKLTDSQEYLKKEERSLIGVVDRRAKKREEEEAKKKKAHPVKPLKLEAKQSVIDAELSPDGKYAIVSLTTEAEKGKKSIVAAYVTESAYVEDLPARAKVGDQLAVTKVASIDTTNGEVKWFAHGLTAPAKNPSPVAKAPAKTDEQARTTSDTGQATAERTEKAETPPQPKERDVAFGSLVWSDDGTKAVIPLRSRDNKEWWVLAFDPATAKGRVIATTHDDAGVRWPNVDFIGWMPDNQNVWFLSESSGYEHLYSVPYAGGAPRALTSGTWEIFNVDRSDDKTSFYLTTSEESPYVHQLYRMPVEGGARVKLTSTPGNHEAVVSPDGAAIGEIYSYTNKPSEVYLNGARVTTSPSPEFAAYSWLDVPIVTFKARDGVDVPARIYKPAGYAGGPAVIFVHGAGYLQNVHRWWSSYFREYMFHHFLMEHGYLVLDVDYRGSAGYGRDWRTAIYRHMGGKDLEDQLDAAHWLVQQHGVDPKRIGVYGGSYGGFITLMALFTAPGTFTAGAALRPVSDWAHYNNSYTSNILNTPQSDPEAYRRSSPIYFADGLRDNLLICHGVTDTNVFYQDSVRLVQKLI
ncbi:MAG: prolyl oligopeptidase family serine peptidase, partial [Thermoanaerobaculia bacterium]